MTRKGFVLCRGFALFGLITFLAGPTPALGQDRIVVSVDRPAEVPDDRQDTTPWLLGMGSIDLLIGGVALFAGGLALEESYGMSGDVLGLYAGGAVALSVGIALGLAALHLTQRVLRRSIELDVTPTDRGAVIRIRGAF